jgi:hypothetical protein
VSECDQVKSQKPSTPAVNKQIEEGRTKQSITVFMFVTYLTTLSVLFTLRRVDCGVDIER